MKIFLAGVEAHAGTYLSSKDVKDVFILESFYYSNEKTEKFIPFFGDFLLDSGAYTLFSSKAKNIDWNEYVDRYADFINKNKVNKFFELDIDKLIGYENVLKLRARLEAQTGRKCIPVWHKTRGKEEYLKMCDEYPYVAVGGLVGSGGTSSEYSRHVIKYFHWFVNEAHRRGAKIHALGFTNLKGLEEFGFDSVDSTSWLAGNKFGYIYRFNGRTLEKIAKKEGQRLVEARKVIQHNFNEWKKFQKYAYIKL